MGDQDIVEKLRQMAAVETSTLFSQRLALKTAANLIESLRSELARIAKEREEAMKALEPFAKVALVYDGHEDTDPVLAVIHSGERINVTVGDLRRAAAIRQMGEKP